MTEITTELLDRLEGLEAKVRKGAGDEIYYEFIAELRNSARSLIALAREALWVRENAPHAYLCPASPLGNPVAIGPCNCWKSKRPAE